MSEEMSAEELAALEKARSAADIANRFTYHPPKHELDQPARYEIIRDRIGELASWLTDECPPSRELSLAITYLEEAVFWANASIARHE